MRISHLITLLLFPTLCFPQDFSTEGTGGLERAYPAILRSVVHIRVTAKCDGTFRVSSGTGFFVSTSGYIATARHVLLPDCEMDEARSFVRLASGRVGKLMSGPTEVSFRVLAQEATNDIAILALEKNPFEGEVHTNLFVADGGARKEVPVRCGVAPIDETSQRVGTPIAITGYALNDAVEITRIGMLATGERFEPSPDKPVPYVAMGGTSSVFYLATLHVNSGDSGAPVYLLESGKVLGVCLAHLLEPTYEMTARGFENAGKEGSPVYSNGGIAVVAPIKYVLSLLQSAR